MTGPPTWLTGNVPQASDFNGWFQPSAAFKPADSPARTTQTLANDPDLQVTFIANAAYLFIGYLLFTADSGGDIQWTFTGFAGGATLRYEPLRKTAGGS